MDKLFPIHEVIDRTALSHSTIYRLMSEGLFPRPLRIGRRAVRWQEQDLTAWLESRPQAPVTAG